LVKLLDIENKGDLDKQNFENEKNLRIEAEQNSLFLEAKIREIEK
jgi:hypothetical protein